MIKAFRHKGLKKFFETGSHAGIQYRHIQRIRLIVDRLNASQSPKDMNLPGLNLHELHGNLRGFHAVTVQANWRVVFRFEENHAVDVDYLDYH